MVDAVIGSDHTVKASEHGRRIVLPSSCKGSPRQSHQIFQDAMALCRNYGAPTLFITATCNPKWKEIQGILWWFLYKIVIKNANRIYFARIKFFNYCTKNNDKNFSMHAWQRRCRGTTGHCSQGFRHQNEGDETTPLQGARAGRMHFACGSHRIPEERPATFTQTADIVKG